MNRNKLQPGWEDIDELEARIAALEADLTSERRALELSREGHSKVARELVENDDALWACERELAQAQARIAALEQDARRYRWLRVARLGMDVMFEDENEDGPTGVAYRLEGEQLDAAIDAQLSEKPHE